MLVNKVLDSTKGLFYKIWTERVIYANSFIFNEIKNVNEPNLQQQLLYGFIGSVHLTSKMCIPRNPASEDLLLVVGAETHINR